MTSMVLMRTTMMSNKEGLLKFLSTLPSNEDICFVVFTKAEADAILEDRHDIFGDDDEPFMPMPMHKWNDLCESYNVQFPREAYWEDFITLVDKVNESDDYDYGSDA